MEISACVLFGPTEKNSTIAATDHLPEILLLAVKIGLFLKTKETLSLTIPLINTNGHSRQR